MTRVAVVQLAYHRAFTVEGRSYIEEPLGASFPFDVVPAGLADALDHLRSRIAAAYLGQLERKIAAILAWCRELCVRVVVFPEYSIPAAALEHVAQAAGDMVVVAGSHLVDRAALSSGVYDRLGVNRPPLRTAVSPVLHGGHARALVPKLHSSPIENESGALVAGAGWEPVDLPGILPGPIGVSLCIDFIDDESEEVRRGMAEQIEKVRFWAVPSLTPSTHEFQEKAATQARRYKRPVLYANSAEAGRSGIFVDERTSGFAPLVLSLDQGEEALVVADVDLGHCRPGRSTGYGDRPAARPVAVPSLVYSAHERDFAYAEWLDRLAVVLGSTDTEYAKLESAATLVEEARSLLDVTMPPTRSRRLQWFVNTARNLSSVAEVRSLTTEVVFAPDVLPLKAIEEALASGTAAVLRSWHETHPALTGLTEVEARLAAQGARTANGTYAPWTPEGRRAVRQLEDLVREAAPRLRREQQLVTRLEFYVSHFEGEVERQYERAKEAFNTEQYEEAHRIVDAMLAQATAASGQDLGNAGIRAWESRIYLLRSLVLLNLQRLDEAAADVRRLDPESLEPREQLTLVRVLGELGELVAGYERLARVQQMPLSDELRQKTMETGQFLSLKAGTLPTDLVDDPDLLLDAGRLEVEQGHLNRGVRLAIRAMQSTPPRRLRRIAALCVLVYSMEMTIFELTPGAELLTGESRKEVIETIDASLAELGAARANTDVLSLPEGVREKLDDMRRVYFTVIHDQDGFELVQPTDDAVDTVLELAREGDAAGALAATPLRGQPWLDELQAIDILFMARERQQAFERLVALARKYPNRGPIELAMAESLRARGDVEGAIQHAERACELVPGRGYRLLLARCLMEAGLVTRAWEALEQDRERGGPRIIQTLARLADVIRPDVAPELWKEYTDLRPKDFSAKIAHAKALWLIGRRQDAADRAWEVVEQHGRDLEARDLFDSAQLQRIDLPLTLTARERIRRIDDLLHDRFRGKPEAEHYRLTLRVEIPEDPSLPPIDFATLQQAGMVHAFPTEQMVPYLQELQRLGNEASRIRWQLYNRGGLSLTGLAGAEGRTVAEVVAEVFESTEHRICGPFPSAIPLRSLVGAQLVVGDAELLAIGWLDLAGALRQALKRQAATVLVPHECRVRLVNETERLRGDSSLSSAYRSARAACDLITEGTREGWLILLTEVEAFQGLEITAPEVPERRGDMVDETLTTALKEALIFAGAVLADPDRRLHVTVDFYASSGVHPDVVRAHKWKDFAHLKRMTEFLRSAGVHRMTLPDLTRLVLPADESTQYRRQKVLDTLAKRGFPDAVASDELVERARTDRDLESVKSVLDGLEHMAGVREFTVGDPARNALSQLYAEAIGSAFLGANSQRGRLPQPAVRLDAAPSNTEGHQVRIPELSGTDAQLFSSALLERAERLAGSDLTFLDLVLAQVAALTVDRPSAAFAPDPEIPGRALLTWDSPAGRMWKHLHSWAESARPRRAALGRALREAWCLLDELAGAEGPSTVQVLPLLLATGSTPSAISPESRDPSGAVSTLNASLDDPGTEALAILSANWSERPLSRQGWTVAVHQGDSTHEQNYDWETVLKSGAQELARIGGNDVGLPFNERSLPLELPVQGVEAQFPVFVPVEAALLRGALEGLRPAIGLLKALQGRHDGQTYRLLEELEGALGDSLVRREYARQTVNALWRLVRDDPSYLLRWPERRPFTPTTSRPVLESLCMVLHEPKAPLAAGVGSGGVVEERVRQSWAGLDVQVRSTLFFQATQIPGALAARPIRFRVQEAARLQQIELALYRLERSTEYPAALVAQDIMLLRVAMEQQPVVTLRRGVLDLRERVPEVLAQVLDEAGPSPPADEGLMSRHEPALLRVCGAVCGKLLEYHAQRGPTDWLWLTYRLYQWLWAQLESLDPQAREAGIEALAAQAPPLRVFENADDFRQHDLFHPFLFLTRRFDYRLAVVLFALGGMEDLVQPNPDGGAPEISASRASSPALEQRLLELVAQVPPKRAYVSSWFEWHAPDNTSDLALLVLLRLNPDRVAEMSESDVLTHIERWPSVLGELATPQQDLVEGLVRALAHLTSRLGPQTCAKFEDALVRFGDSERERKLKWIGLSSLYGSGAKHLRETVASLVEQHVNEPEAPVALASYLAGVEAEDPGLLEAEVVRLFETWQMDTKRAIEVLTVAVARMAVHTEAALQQRATQVLLALAERPFFRDDERLRELVRHLRLAGTENRS